MALVLAREALEGAAYDNSVSLLQKNSPKRCAKNCGREIALNSVKIC